MRLDELICDLDEVDMSRRGFLRGLGAAGAAGLAGYAATRPSTQEPATAMNPQGPAQDQDEIAKLIKNEPPAEPPVSVAPKEYGPSTSKNANPEMQSKLAQFARKNGITGVELAALLAQCATETLSFTSLVERGDKRYFSQYDGKMGNDKPGDGYKYRGRGFLHITGKEMYAKCSKAFSTDFVRHPELLEKPEVALKTSLWYWNDRVKPFVRDFNDVSAVTRRVNGGLNAIEDRSANFADYKKKLGIS